MSGGLCLAYATAVGATTLKRDLAFYFGTPMAGTAATTKKKAKASPFSTIASKYLANK